MENPKTVGAFVGVGAKVIAQALNKVSRKLGARHAFKVAQTTGARGEWDAMTHAIRHDLTPGAEILF